MFIEDYRAGAYETQTGFKSFIPSPINSSWEWRNTRINTLLEKANMELGSLNAYAELIPNIDIYIRMHIHVEANKSSKIEGTKTTIEEDMLPLMEVDPEKRDDVQEVQNYIAALQYGVERITKDGFPVSSRLIREIHRCLMNGVRGEFKTPGEFRLSQNWIGGSMPSKAAYVPPAHIHIPQLMSDLEQFIHNDSIDVPMLVKAALVHYQFESIHPFLDGNGRTGRILIPLMLLHEGLLKKPCFYISEYFDLHRTEYYDALNRVRTHNDLLGWLLFFLEASVSTAEEARKKFSNAVAFVGETSRIARQLSGKTDNLMRVLDVFFEKPVQTAIQLASTLELSTQTVNRALNQLIQENLIEEKTGNARNRVFVCKGYLDIFQA